MYEVVRCEAHVDCWSYLARCEAHRSGMTSPINLEVDCLLEEGNTAVLEAELGQVSCQRASGDDDW